MDVNNTKQEMFAARKIAIIKDNYDSYSKSNYSNSDFTGDNKNWQYLQQGGAEKILIFDNKQAANKVEHSNNLSETLGYTILLKQSMKIKLVKQ